MTSPLFQNSFGDDSQDTAADALESIMPLTNILRTSFIGGVFFLLLLFALHLSGEVMVPVIFAIILKMVFQPVVRFFARWRIPHAVIAFFIILGLLGSIYGIARGLTPPAMEWADRIRSSYAQLHERLDFIRQPVEKTQTILAQAEDLTKSPTAKEVVPVTVEGARFTDRLLTNTQEVVVEFFTTLFILFSLLAGGDTFLRRMVEVLPRFKDKRQAVAICQKIENDISMYLSTITVMNFIVGCCVSLIMWQCHISNPVMWGVLAFLLNYIPFLGPFIAVAIFSFAGMVVIQHSWTAFLPAMTYFCVQILEGSVLTPMMLAKRFTLNPVLIILSIIFWHWMWGVTGAILAMPMLAVSKIFCDHIQGLKSIGHFLEG